MNTFSRWLKLRNENQLQQGDNQLQQGDHAQNQDFMNLYRFLKFVASDVEKEKGQKFPSGFISQITKSYFRRGVTQKALVDDPKSYMVVKQTLSDALDTPAANTAAGGHGFDVRSIYGVIRPIADEIEQQAGKRFPTGFITSVSKMFSEKYPNFNPKNPQMIQLIQQVLQSNISTIR